MTKNVGTVNTAASFSVFYTLVNTMAQVFANEVVTANNAPGGGAMSIGNGFVTGIFGANTVVGSQIQGGNVTNISTLFLGSNLTSNGATVTVTVGGFVVNSSLLQFGSNVNVNTSIIAVGNSVVNTFINSTAITTGSFTANQPSSFTNATFNNANTANLNVSVALNAGANVIVNTTTMFVGNTANNAVVNNTGFFYNGVQLTIPPSINTTTTGVSLQTIDTFAIATYRAAEYVLSIKDNNANNFQATKILVTQDGGTAYLQEYGTIITNTDLGSFSTTISAGNLLLQLTPTSSNTTVKGARTLVVV